MFDDEICMTRFGQHCVKITRRLIHANIRVLDRRAIAVLLTLVDPADDAVERQLVSLETEGGILALGLDVAQPLVQPQELAAAVEQLLAQRDQIQLSLVDRTLEHQGMGLGGGERRDQLALGLGVPQGRGAG